MAAHVLTYTLVGIVSSGTIYPQQVPLTWYENFSSRVPDIFCSQGTGDGATNSFNEQHEYFSIVGSAKCEYKSPTAIDTTTDESCDVTICSATNRKPNCDELSFQ